MSDTHEHKAANKQPTRRIMLVLLLTATYMIAEAVGGFVSNSLSLLSDAGHMLADVAALLISLFAFKIAARPPNDKASFGYHRAEVIAALFNGLALIIVSFFIIKEAIERLFNPAEINTGMMMTVAIGGLAVNLGALALLHRDKSHNLNIRGAWLHVLSDTLGSIGVISSGLLIHYFGWRLADPIASMVIAGLVSYSSLNLIFATLRVLMEHTPEHINPGAVLEEILSLPDAIKVHDLHIWSIGPGKVALSVHVMAEQGANYDRLLCDIQQVLVCKFGIDHATVQLENRCPAPDKACHTT